MGVKFLFGGESLTGASREAVSEGFEVVSSPAGHERVFFSGAPAKDPNPARRGFLSRGFWDNTSRVTEEMESTDGK
jgi:hypothetical protein